MSLLTRFSPFSSYLDDVVQFRQAMDQVLGDWTQEPVADNPCVSAGFPALNVWQDDACFYAEAELPGIEQADVEIHVTGENQLTVQGIRRQLENLKTGSYLRQERGFGNFSRVLTLPVAVDASKVEARLVQGVLTIKLPKSEAAKPRMIPIKAGT
jgi:HSP20 family protein